MHKTKPLDKERLKSKVGGRPGSLHLPEKALKPRFFLITYNENFFEEQEFGSYPELMAYFQEHSRLKHWSP